MAHGRAGLAVGRDELGVAGDHARAVGGHARALRQAVEDEAAVRGELEETARLLAEGVVGALGPFGPHAVLFGLLIATNSINYIAYWMLAIGPDIGVLR